MTIALAAQDQAWCDLLKTHYADANAFITLTVEGATPNREQMRELLRRFTRKLMRRLLGRRWFPRRRQFDFVAVLEKEGLRPHFHLLAKSRSPYMSDRQKQVDALLSDGTVDRLWRAVLKEVGLGATTDVREYDRDRGAIPYILKERKRNRENVVFASELV